MREGEMKCFLFFGEFEELKTTREAPLSVRLEKLFCYFLYFVLCFFECDFPGRRSESREGRNRFSDIFTHSVKLIYRDIETILVRIIYMHIFSLHT